MNPHKGDVSFEAGGKSYTLRFSTFALVKLEESLGKSLVEIMNEISRLDTMRLKTVVALLWAGLQKHHPGTTEEDAANLIDDVGGGIAGVMPHINDAFERAFGKSSGTKGTNPTQKPANGIGTGSSSSTPVTATIPMPSGNALHDNSGS